MIRFKVKELLADKSFNEGRRVTLDQVSQQTGIARATLNRIANKKGVNTNTDNLDALCAYFGVGVGEIAEYVPESAEK